MLWAYIYTRRQKKRKSRWWVHDILKKLKELGEYHRLVKELELDGERFHQYFRMSTEQFSHIVDIIGPELAKQATNFRQPIGVEERLAIIIRWVIFRSVVWKKQYLN